MPLLPIRRRPASAILATLLAVAPTWADETSDANALLVAAVRAWDQAQAMRACLIDAAMADLPAQNERDELGMEAFRVIDALAVADDPQGALELADAITDTDVVHDPILEIALAQARAGQVTEALITGGRLSFGHEELILQFWDIDPDPAYVTAMRARFERKVSGYRRDLALAMSVMEPRPGIFAELETANAAIEDDHRDWISSNDTLLLCAAGRSADAAALTLLAAPGTQEPFDRITNLAYIARTMADDPRLSPSQQQFPLSQFETFARQPTRPREKYVATLVEVVRRSNVTKTRLENSHGHVAQDPAG